MDQARILNLADEVVRGFRDYIDTRNLSDSDKADIWRTLGYYALKLAVEEHSVRLGTWSEQFCKRVAERTKEYEVKCEKETKEFESIQAEQRANAFRMMKELAVDFNKWRRHTGYEFFAAIISFPDSELDKISDASSEPSGIHM